MHFTEEVELLEEEMKYVLPYLEWQEGWWHMKGLCLGWEGLPEATLKGYVYMQSIKWHYIDHCRNTSLYCRRMYPFTFVLHAKLSPMYVWMATSQFSDIGELLMDSQNCIPN